jgi:hypothetical protein
MGGGHAEQRVSRLEEECRSVARVEGRIGIAPDPIERRDNGSGEFDGRLADAPGDLSGFLFGRHVSQVGDGWERRQDLNLHVSQGRAKDFRSAGRP